MIVNQTPYPISFEMKTAQALTCRYGEVGRQYKFIADIDLTGLSANLQVIKPDGTFVIEDASVVVTEDEQYIVVEIPLQATVVKGVCRYDINLYEDEDLMLYTAEGPLWVDDQLITEDMIESVAEVYGLRFPQDFLTVENLVDIVNYVKAQIVNDEAIAEDTTWSSQKIEQEISGVTPDIDVSKTVTGNPIEFSDGADAPLVKCVTQITGYQEGSGTPSPDNIRPIVAYSTGTIEVEDGDGNTTTHTTTYPSAIYRGSEDVVEGEVVTEWGVIASYSGETLPGEWISDRDEYAPGTTPTTGAQVAYELATPTTSSVTPTNLPIKSLSGYTHIESSTGDMNLEYLKQTYDPLAELIERSSIHVYSTEEKIVGKWIDGSPVYEMTVDKHLNPVLMYAYSWYVFDTLMDSIKIIDAFGIDVNNGIIKSCYPIVADFDNGDISVMHLRNGVQIAMGYVTIRYIKTS